MDIFTFSQFWALLSLHRPRPTEFVMEVQGLLVLIDGSDLMGNHHHELVITFIHPHSTSCLSLTVIVGTPSERVQLA